MLQVNESDLGALASLATAFVWAASVILFKRSGEHIGPYALNLFKNSISLPLFALTLWWLDGDDIATFDSDTITLLLSGAVGIGVADVLFFAGLNRLGAARMAIVDCLYSPSVVFFAVILLGEELSPLHAVGATLILSAVFLGSRDEKRSKLSRTALGPGILFGAAAVILMGSTIVVIKPILARHGVVWAVTVRMVGGLILQAIPLFFISSLRKEALRAFLPHSGLRFAIPGAFLGTYAALLLWIYGFKHTSANVAGILNQTSTIFVVLLAALFLREQLTKRSLLSVLLASCGSLLVLL